jgi:hypothetical protein
MDGLMIGRIVHYVLTDVDAYEVNRSRNDSYMANSTRAYVGNLARRGDHLPAIVTWVPNKERGYINAQVLLDGNDSMWVTTRSYSEELEPGTWHWAERA